VGAVIREINLLILLAGTMIGLLNLQWRFNTRTLQGLKVRRRIPLRTMVGVPTDVSIEVTNPRRWLGSWLVLAEDQLQKVQPNVKRLTEKGVALIDDVPHQRDMNCDSSSEEGIVSAQQLFRHDFPSDLDAVGESSIILSI
jgi:hypothetical protein